MKKILLFAGVILILFAGLYFVNMQSNKAKEAQYKDNVYGKPVSKLHPETIKLLDDPNYRKTIAPKTLSQKIADKESFYLYFYASDCVHCRATTPKLAALEDELGKDIPKLNLRENPELFSTYKITATPTLVYFENGVETDRLVGGIEVQPGDGGNPEETFREFLSKH